MFRRQISGTWNDGRNSQFAVSRLSETGAAQGRDCERLSADWGERLGLAGVVMTGLGGHPVAAYLLAHNFSANLTRN